MDGQPRITGRQVLLAAGGLALAWALVGGMYLLSGAEQFPLGPNSAATQESGVVTIADAEAQPRLVVLPALLQVYRAYEESDEVAIYNALAKVAAGDALTELYLQRRQSIVDNGLEAATQTLHRLDLVDAAADRNGQGLAVRARWQVIGTVGHSTHTHVRGNAYAADLNMALIAGAWRITGFTLRDIDVSLAGSMVPGSDASTVGLVGEDLTAPAPEAGAQ
jgi:hypothetical protein